MKKKAVFIFTCFFMIFVISCGDSKKSVVEDSEKGPDVEVNDDSGDTEDPDIDNDVDISDDDFDKDFNDEDVDDVVINDEDVDDEDVDDEDIDDEDVDDEDVDDGPIVCVDHEDCPSKSTFCLKKDGDCKGKGICSEKEILCNPVIIPVCGCDGKTYNNQCEAHAVGINVDFDGECPSTVTYRYESTGMPPILLEGSTVVNQLSDQDVFDDPNVPVWGRTTTVTFNFIKELEKKNQMVFSINGGDLPDRECTKEKPCEIKLGKSDSNAVWYINDGEGGRVENGSLTGTIYILAFENEDFDKKLIFYSNELVFNPPK